MYQTSLASLVVPVLPARFSCSWPTEARAGAAADGALQHRGHLVGGDRVHHPLGVGVDERQAGLGEVVGGAALAGALVVAVDGLAVAVLHPVDQRRLDLEPAVGDLGIGGDHLVERRLAGAERIGEQPRHVVVDAEALAVARDRVHADVLGDAHGHQVARLLEAGADRRRAVVGAARVLRRPDAGRRSPPRSARRARWCRGCSRCRARRHRRRA